MNPLFQRLMRATQLTRKGDLQAATAAIQSALAQRSEAVETRADVLDVEARELPDTATHDQAAEAFVDGSFGSGPARRDYKLYIPPAAGAAALPLPLVVMLHGCTQDAGDFAVGTAMNELARAQGWYVLYPEQSPQANPQRCWNWFKHNHQVRDRGEPATLAGMTRAVMAQHAIDPRRVYVAGLSAGGAMAAILGDAYPDLYAAVGVHSGLATGAAKDVPSAFGAMKSGSHGRRGAASGVPTIVFHGDGDHTVHPVNGSEVIAASVRAGTAVETEQGRTAGGRRYTRELHRAADGKVVAEHWVVHGAPHAWAGGSAKGSYTDPSGPDASAQMLRFFASVTSGPQPQ
jgi:poly(hydroxyalkanoate) depolymerase family esterase